MRLIFFSFLIALFFILGIYVGDNNRPEIDKVIGVSNKETQVATQADFSPFWKVWNVMNDKSPTSEGISGMAMGGIQNLFKGGARGPSPLTNELDLGFRSGAMR